MAILPRTNGTGAAGGSSLTPTITTPSGVQAGDVMIVSIGCADNRTLTDNNGSTPFTEIRQDDPGDGSMRGSIWIRVAGASEPASYTWNLSGAGTPGWGVVISTYTGVDNTTPQDATATFEGNTANAGTTTNAPTLTTVTDGAFSICVSLIDGTNAYSAYPSGYTQRVENSDNIRVSLVDLEIPTAGATGDQGWTYASGNESIGYQVALRPAATGDPEGLLIGGKLVGRGLLGGVLVS